MNDIMTESTSALPRAGACAELSGERALRLEQLTQAVADNALLNTEVDRKIVARLLETREEIRTTQRAVEDLRQQFERLVRNLGQVLEITRLEWQRQANTSSAPEGLAAPATLIPRLIAPERLLAMGANVRLNLGCGLIPTPDYLNIDARELPSVDMVADVRSLPFHPGTVSEIYAAHLVEHFTEADLKSTVLLAWHRILKAGGLLRVVVPDAEGMIQAFSRGQYPFESLREVTFGSQDYPGNYHYTMFSRESLRGLLRASGFVVGEYTAVGRPNGLCLEMEIEARKSL